MPLKGFLRNLPRDLPSHPSDPSPNDNSSGHQNEGRTPHKHLPVHSSLDRTPGDSPSALPGHSLPPVSFANSPNSRAFQQPTFTFNNQSSQQNASYSNKNHFHSPLSQNFLSTIMQTSPRYPYLHPTPAIPTLSHIPLLTGKTDFDSWDRAIRETLSSMGLLDHIYDPSFGLVTPEGSMAVGRPEGVDDPAPQDAASMTWWRDDEIVAHVLRNRLSPDIPAFPLGVVDAKGLYAEIYRTYSARDWHTGKVLWDGILRLDFDSVQLLDYCKRWRSAFMRIRSTRYPLPVTMAIDHFLQQIPDVAVPILAIKSNFYKNVHAIDENDPQDFLLVIRSVEVCAIDFQDHQTIHAHNLLPSTLTPDDPPCISSQNSVPAVSTTAATNLSNTPALAFCEVDQNSPEMVDRIVRSLVKRLTPERFDPISDQIIKWANKSERERDGRTLIQVIRLVFEKATDEAAWSEMYARLCRKMMEQISNKVQDDGIRNPEGKPIAGGQLFRKYLLNRCQEDFERGWVAKETTAAAAASKALEDEAAKASNEKDKEGGGTGEVTLYSEEYYAAQKAKRQGLGLIRFIGELFKLQMLTERIMHECVKKLVGNVNNPEEEEIESLCKLLSTVGSLLDTQKAHAHMDVYFQRMRELTKSLNVSPRMQFMLQDVIELRDRKWVTRNAVAAPATIAQTHEAAAKEKAAHEKEYSQRQISTPRGGSRRGGDRSEQPPANSKGWAVAGNTTRPPPKAGDLSNFGKISKAPPTMFGPSSVFVGKNADKRESSPRTGSNSNMFSILLAAESGADKTADAQPQRRRLILQPRTKPLEQTENQQQAESSEDEEASSSAAPTEMSEEAAKKKINEDSKEFFGVRSLDEAEVYFTVLPTQHHHKLIDKLASSAVESKEADAQLVSDLFTRAASKNLCSPSTFEKGLTPVAEVIDDIAIDVPKAFTLFATIVKGVGFDEDQRSRLASRSMDSDKLLALLS